jgi:formate dehydrogenase maturation protein FdhE
MKSKLTLTKLLVITAAFACATVRGQEPHKMHQMGMQKQHGMMPMMDVKMMEMQKKQDAELDELIAEMNATTGEKRIDAIMAVLNKLVEQRKEMHAEMASHGSMQMPSASPAATMSPMEHMQ